MNCGKNITSVDNIRCVFIHVKLVCFLKYRVVCYLIRKKIPLWAAQNLVSFIFQRQVKINVPVTQEHVLFCIHL